MKSLGTDGVEVCGVAIYLIAPVAAVNKQQ